MVALLAGLVSLVDVEGGRRSVQEELPDIFAAEVLQHFTAAVEA